MKHLGAVRSIILALTISLAARPSPAQVTLSTDAGVYSAYVFRGVSLTNRLVLEPDAYLTVPAGGGSLILTGWSNVDLGRYDDPAKDISEGGGQSSLDFTEIDLIGEYDHPLGPSLNGGVGSITYLYPNRTNPVVPGLFTNDVNRTFEVFGKLQLTKVPLTPKLAVYYDVDKVKGAYFEGSVSQGLNVIRGFPITLGLIAGFSAGQGVNVDKPAEIANFAKNSLTHLDFSAAGAVSLGHVLATPMVHVYYLNDDFTRITRPGTLKDVKACVGLSLSWTKALSVVPTKAH